MNDRRIIEKAKELVIQATGLSETDAFRRLQQMACQQKKRIVDAAQLMISTCLIGMSGAKPRESMRGELLGLPLTPSEQNVARQIALGRSNQEISELLGCNLDMVAVHKATAMRKLGLRSRTELVRYAESQNWFDR